MIKAFCWMLPPSGGVCFLDNRSVDGIFQFGSEIAINARSGSVSTGFSIGFLTSIFGVDFSSSAVISTPLDLIFNGPSAPALIASSA